MLSCGTYRRLGLSCSTCGGGWAVRRRLSCTHPDTFPAPYPSTSTVTSRLRSATAGGDGIHYRSRGRCKKHCDGGESTRRARSSRTTTRTVAAPPGLVVV